MRVILFKRTCYFLSLRWGALGTFVFSLLISMVPLFSLRSQIDNISMEILIMNVCQIAFATFVSVFAIIGTIQIQPQFLLPFLTYYVGFAIIDLASVVCTILIGYPFYAHDLLKGGGLRKKPYTKAYVQITVIFYLIIFALRLYFTFIVYCFYEELKKSTEPDGSPENSEETTVLPDTSKGSTKGSVNEI